MPKADVAFSRSSAVYDTTIGWRFVNPLMKHLYGTDSMPETAENVAAEYRIAREDQDAFGLRSQNRALAAQASGRLAREIVPVEIPSRKGDPVIVDRDEHPRQTTLEALAKLKPIVRPDGTVTAGNASGVNDGACALILATEAAARRHGFTPMARVVSVATAGCAPGLAVLRELGVADDDPRVNPNGGAIALGHPLGMSGARLVGTAAHELHERNGRVALATMCIGVGQGIAAMLERV
jgi:acetyl-CoA acetyltransferase